jgi:hypothetical protein
MSDVANLTPTQRQILQTLDRLQGDSSSFVGGHDIGNILHLTDEDVHGNLLELKQIGMLSYEKGFGESVGEACFEEAPRWKFRNWLQTVADRAEARLGAPEPKPVGEATPPAATEGSADETADGTPEILRGVRIERPKLVKMLGVTRQTLINWDRRRRCATVDMPWQPGERVGGNMCLYDVYANWPALKAYAEKYINKQSIPSVELAEELIGLRFG